VGVKKKEFSSGTSLIQLLIMTNAYLLFEMYRSFLRAPRFYDEKITMIIFN
jgi:hypothetical protein